MHMYDLILTSFTSLAISIWYWAVTPEVSTGVVTDSIVLTSMSQIAWWISLIVTYIMSNTPIKYQSRFIHQSYIRSELYTNQISHL